MFEGIEDEAFEQLLIGDAHLDGVACGTVLLVPRLHQRDVQGPPRLA